MRTSGQFFDITDFCLGCPRGEDGQAVARQSAWRLQMSALPLHANQWDSNRWGSMGKSFSLGYCR